MATVTSAAVTLPTFTGLKAASASSARPTTARVATTTPKFSIKASWKDLGVAAAATAATAVIASNAMAFDVLMGGDNGELAFIPNTFEVAAGEKISFKNNEAFPHNVVFDEDEVPAGVDASKISMDEEDALNAKGEVYAVTLTEKGTYTFYCNPHRGAGMTGKVTVK